MRMTRWSCPSRGASLSHQVLEQVAQCSSTMGLPCGSPCSRTWSVPLEVSTSVAPWSRTYASLVVFETTSAFSKSSTISPATTPRVILAQPAIGRLVRDLRPGAFLRAEAELIGALRERLDDQGDVLVLVDPELLDPPLNLISVDRRSEGRLLELLLDRLRPHALDARGADQGAGGDEAGELVHGIERLRHPGLAGDAHEVGVAAHCVDHLLRIAAVGQLLDCVAGMAGLEVRVALVVEG